VERIGRSIGGRVEFFPRDVFFSIVQAKTGLTGFPNRPDWFRPVGCREGFLSKEVSVALWLLLFRCGKAREVFWVFGEFLDKVGMTGLPNRSDRFPLPA
jgi:predicted thioredoxin/glutaredoxin